jgi:hypothetical protein
MNPMKEGHRYDGQFSRGLLPPKYKNFRGPFVAIAIISRQKKLSGTFFWLVVKEPEPPHEVSVEEIISNN